MVDAQVTLIIRQRLMKTAIELDLNINYNLHAVDIEGCCSVVDETKIY